jgi:hypothetical protein
MKFSSGFISHLEVNPQITPKTDESSRHVPLQKKVVVKTGQYYSSRPSKACLTEAQNMT